MAFSLFRDQGRWSAYECGSEWGGRFPTREAVEVEVRRLQEMDLNSAKVALEIAKRKIAEAEAELRKPVSVAVPSWP